MASTYNNVPVITHTTMHRRKTVLRYGIDNECITTSGPNVTSGTTSGETSSTTSSSFSQSSLPSVVTTLRQFRLLKQNLRRSCHQLSPYIQQSRLFKQYRLPPSIVETMMCM
ncbi:hypothetical protein KIN20_027525 [Parelaphostrongylus tenuis]|uniref:Uncharacterized protein n=1 Tax=Parelaphostrongylus tenuis TaxID=148309 RepID=A0AAD5WDY2_PARTN|nr:hypothetical protein KIN20_027525 [Parelaphostrongylus tenuis]